MPALARILLELYRGAPASLQQKTLTSEQLRDVEEEAQNDDRLSEVALYGSLLGRRQRLPAK